MSGGSFGLVRLYFLKYWLFNTVAILVLLTIDGVLVFPAHYDMLHLAVYLLGRISQAALIWTFVKATQTSLSITTRERGKSFVVFCFLPGIDIGEKLLFGFGIFFLLNMLKHKEQWVRYFVSAFFVGMGPCLALSSIFSGFARGHSCSTRYRDRNRYSTPSTSSAISPIFS